MEYDKTIEYIDIDNFLSFKKSEDEKLTVEEQVEKLHQDYPMFRREIIKALVGCATQEDLDVIKKEQDDCRRKLEEGGYKLDEEKGIFIQSENIDNFSYNKVDEYDEQIFKLDEDGDTPRE